MNKKIFICGRIYDLATASKIEERIQKRVDKITIDPDSGNPNQRLVTFSMEVTALANNTEADIEFTFARNNMFAREGINPDFINDSDAMLIMGMDGKFQPPVMWEMVEPFAFGRYHIPIFEFVPAYTESAKALGASEIKGIQIESTKTELKLKIRV